jgi:hypothetical protein
MPDRLSRQPTSSFTHGRLCRSVHAAVRLVLASAVVLVSSSQVGCKPSGNTRPSPTTVSPQAPAIGYGLGRWRLAPFEEVNRTVLWVSHIIIMSKDSNPADPSFRPMTWRPDPPMPARSDAEALSRALMVADLAAKDPEHFDELARVYSDDVVTKDRGGSLGGVRGGQLPSAYRDALATLRPGETSRVIRTSLGYSVIKRRPVPADAPVAGSRIVIRYKGTVGGPRGAASERERDVALELANRVAAEAQSGVTSFDRLVEKYSENADAAQHGDMGLWSLRDPGFLPRQIERLGELRVGEVAPPIETIFGFEILLRTAADSRPSYALELVQIPYDPAAPVGNEHSEGSVARLAADLARQLRRDPAPFDTLRDKYCCVGAQQWTAGRGPVGVAPVLDTLKFGEIAAAPIQTNLTYLIPRRVDPATVPAAPPLRYELPSPDGPDLDPIVRDTEAAPLALYTRSLSDEVAKILPLPEAERKETSRQLDELSDAFKKGDLAPAARVEAMHATLARLKTTLGAADFAVFDRFLRDWSTRLALGRLGHVGGQGLPADAMARLKRP